MNEKYIIELSAEELLKELELTRKIQDRLYKLAATTENINDIQRTELYYRKIRNEIKRRME